MQLSLAPPLRITLRTHSLALYSIHDWDDFPTAEVSEHTGSGHVGSATFFFVRSYGAKVTRSREW